MDLKKAVVKYKRFQVLAGNHAILIPKKWIETCNWNRNTELTLEFLPERKQIIITENEKVSDIKLV